MDLSHPWLMLKAIEEKKQWRNEIFSKMESHESPETESENIIKKEELGNKLIGAFQEFFYLEKKNNFVTCNDCSSVVTLNSKAMIEHMKIHHPFIMMTISEAEEIKVSDHDSGKSCDDCSEHLDEVLKYFNVDHGKRRSELAKFGKEHSIKLNFNGGKGYCFICDTYLSAHMNIYKQHVKGALHRAHLELLDPKTVKKQSTKEFKTKSILQCNLHYEPGQRSFWINNDYSIDVYSFFFLRQIEDDPHFKKTKCFACNELILQGQEREHCEIPKHRNNFLAAKYIEFAAHSEFFREIRTNLFHCGFCNQTFPFLTPLPGHITSFKHLEMRQGKIDYPFIALKIKSKADVYKEKDYLYNKLLYYGFGTQ